MFEVGKVYRISTGDGGERAYSVYTLLEVALPLIKVEGDGGTKIINTKAPSFIEAEPLETDPEARAIPEMAEAFTDGDAEDYERDQEHVVDDGPSTPPTGY